MEVVIYGCSNDWVALVFFFFFFCVNPILTLIGNGLNGYKENK